MQTIEHQLKRPKRGNSIAPPTAKGARQAMDTSTYENAAQVSPDKPLTSQQLAFAKYWARGESIASAALRAGYAQESIAYRLRLMPNVLRVYEAEKKAYEAAGQMTRKKVMDGLIEAIEMAKLMAEPASMISGWREIGKLCGYYEPVKHTLDVNIKGDVTVRQLNGMSDAELLKIITGDEPLKLPSLDEDEVA